MNIIIIGSDGFIGKHILQCFSKENKCFCAIRKPVNEELLNSNTIYIRLDRENPDYDGFFKQSIDMSGKIDVCINASGSADISASLKNPLADSISNFLNVERILEAIRNNNPTTKFITLSSAAVYGNPKSLPVNEYDARRPISPYGYHKLCSEEICGMYHSIYGLNTYVLRLFSVYGIGQKKLLLWDLVNKFLTDQVVKLSGTGRESRDYINVRDVVNVVSIFVRGQNNNGEEIDSGCYNIANGKQIYISEVAEMVRVALNSNKQIVFDGNVRCGDPINWEADINKLLKLGYRQQVSIKDGIKEYVDWAREKIMSDTTI